MGTQLFLKPLAATQRPIKRLTWRWGFCFRCFRGLPAMQKLDECNVTKRNCDRNEPKNVSTDQQVYDVVSVDFQERNFDSELGGIRSCLSKIINNCKSRNAKTRAAAGMLLLTEKQQK